MRILYVEDNDDNVYVIKNRFARVGFTVLVATDGEQGMAMAVAERPDLILMDLGLPGLDGWEATRRIKSQPETRHIPVIALSAHAMTGDRERALEAGCDDFDTKPVEMPRLLSKVRALLPKEETQIEAGRMELEVTDFDLPQAILNALTLVRERAGRRGIALQQAVDQRLGEVRGDERKIKQVLLNLLSNALKFTPEGGRVDVRASLADGMAEIAVTDTGVGIAPEDQEAVFEEFRQVGTAAKKVEGTGLGLALSRKFVELHGGRIWVKSAVGMGSTFTFTIPVRRGE